MEKQFTDSRCHALALARWEDNFEFWREGQYLGLYSRKPLLQQKVGAGGALWIVVSRPQPDGGRMYSISFRLNNCQLETRPTHGQFGRYGVLGDPHRSQVFASNDAKLALMSLRFEPFKPIKQAGIIGQSLQTPRSLTAADVQLLEDYAAAADRWSVFISYQSVDHKLAARLSNALGRSGVNVFRDKDALRGGEQWWPALERAIKRSRYLVLLMGETTHESEWVQKELQVALDNNIRIIPVLAGADKANWRADPRLLTWEALKLSDDWNAFYARLLDAIGSPAAPMLDVVKF